MTLYSERRGQSKMKTIYLSVVNMRTSEHDILIDRRTPFGNPFPVKKGANGREQCLKKFQRLISNKPDVVLKLRDAIVEFAERVPSSAVKVRLGCWCSPLPCHGDILINRLLQCEWPHSYYVIRVYQPIGETK